MFNTDRLFLMMKKKGLKTQYICSLISSNRNMLYDWKRGKSEPSDNDLMTIANALGTTIEYLKNQTENTVKETLGINDLDYAFQGDYNSLSENDKEAIRNLARLLRNKGTQK